MNKKNKLIQDRNNRIREKVWHYMIRMPRMLAYAKAAVEFDLSEDRVREIVARRWPEEDTPIEKIGVFFLKWGILGNKEVPICSNFAPSIAKDMVGERDDIVSNRQKPVKKKVAGTNKKN